MATRELKDSTADDDAWADAAGWEAPVRFRRQRNLLLSAEERIALVENMIEMAISAGVFRNKFGEPFPITP